jgi:hypothetical protein
MNFIAGLLAGLLPFVAAFTAMIVFGFLLEAYGELAVIPAPVITFLLAAMVSTRRWQLGVVTGLAVSSVVLTFFAGPWAVPMFVFPMVVAWALGRLVAGWRASHAYPTEAINARGWLPSADISPVVQPGLSSAGASAPPTTADRDPRILIAALGAVAVLAVIAWQFAGAPGMPPTQTLEPYPGMPTISDVLTGQCFDEVLVDQVSVGIEIRPCATAHEYETFGSEAYPAPSGAPYPGDATMSDAANRFCSAAFTTYVGVPPGSSALSWSSLSPSESSWSGDDRWIGCLVGEAPPAAPLVGSVKGTRQ